MVLFRPICCTYLSINIHKPLRASPVHVIEADGESSEFYRFLVHSGKALADRCWQGGPVFKKYSAGEPKASKYSYQDGKHVPTFQGNNYDKCIYIYTRITVHLNGQHAPKFGIKCKHIAFFHGIFWLSFIEVTIFAVCCHGAKWSNRKHVINLRFPTAAFDLLNMIMDIHRSI